MAKAEGWWSKKDRNGNETSKWQTMPELMLRYRAATFLIRSVAPDIALGFPTTEEAIDITDQTTVVSNTTLDEVAKAAVAEQAQVVTEPKTTEETEQENTPQDEINRMDEEEQPKMPTAKQYTI